MLLGILLGATGLGWADWVHCKSTADYSTGWLSSLSLHARVNKAILGKSLMPEPRAAWCCSKNVLVLEFTPEILEYVASLSLASLN